MDVFCTKYFHREETVTLATLLATKQRNGEDLTEYIKRSRDIALDCYDHCKENTLVEMCMIYMTKEYKAILENLEISQFAQLLQKARKTAQVVRPSFDKRNAPQAMAVFPGGRKRKVDGREYDTPPLLPCTPKELDVLHRRRAEGPTLLSLVQLCVASYHRMLGTLQVGASQNQGRDSRVFPA